MPFRLKCSERFLTFLWKYKNNDQTIFYVLISWAIFIFAWHLLSSSSFASQDTNLFSKFLPFDFSICSECIWYNLSINCPAINNLANDHPALDTGGSKTNCSWFWYRGFVPSNCFWNAWSTPNAILESSSKFVDWKSIMNVPMPVRDVNFFYL